MKKQLTKVLVLSLLVAGAASCGKDNEKSSATTNTTTSNPVNSNSAPNIGEGTCASVQNLDQLKAIYNNWSTSNYTLPKQKYTYEEYEMGEYELKEKESWFFNIPYTKLERVDTFKRTSTKDSSTAQSEFGGSKEGIRLNTLAVLNRVSPFDIRVYSSSNVEVIDSNGDVYGFNLCAPIAANPVSIYDESEEKLVKLDCTRTEQGRICYY